MTRLAGPMTRHRPAVVALAAFLAAGASAGISPANAQDRSWTVEGSAAVVSDYRYRGYSLSGSDPAVQANLTASHASGFYGDVFVSTIAESGVDADGDGADVEVTLTAGWAGEIGGLEVDLALSAYQYPDGSDVSYAEIPVQVGQTRGALTWTVGAAWAPGGQDALGGEDNRYLWAGLDLAPPAWPVSLRGTVGYEDGAYAPGGKTDWLVGVAAPVGGLRLGLDYVDSDADEAALVARLSVEF